MTVAATTPQRYPNYSFFAAVLSGAGLPIYIYAPEYYATTYGVSLTTLGLVLGGLRFLDFIQDPLLGWISERLRDAKAASVTGGVALLAASMIGLFAVQPPLDPVWWFAITITGLFSAFSFLTINFYAQGIARVAHISDGHVRLAAWRESGALFGICLAAVAPTLLMTMSDSGFDLFAWGFAVLALLAAAAMWREWTPAPVEQEPTPIKDILADTQARRLLLLALVNATPVAVSSTLFLFFVDARLEADGWEGPLLVLFFFAAAVSSPIWSLLAQRFGEKRVLLSAMVLAIVVYVWALTLGAGDVIPFAIICVLSGATIGADLTLLPALFAKRMSRVAPNGGQGFGLWSLVSKFTLAFAAITLLPLLERSGFDPTASAQPDEALMMLAVLYALVPSVLKLVAIGLLAVTQLED